jgi:3-methyladenine DNA glycosylase AlkC
MLLKDIFSQGHLSGFAAHLHTVYPAFKSKPFIKAIYSDAWKQFELKQRMDHIARVMHPQMPAAFPEAAKIIRNLLVHFRGHGVKESTLEYCFIPHYIELYGLEHYAASVKTIEQLTSFTSCEYVVRQFLLKHEDKMIAQMQRWSHHKDLHVRRLSSEGIRPRLPWAIGLPRFKHDPDPILPILNQLKNDPSEYVRRSVANNLNDISKDNRDIAIGLIRSWQGISPETDWVIKHGSRTLLKQGDKTVLNIFGLDHSPNIKVTNLKILTPVVHIGNKLNFSFTIANLNKTERLLRLEYAVHFFLANGTHTRKVFKINERAFAPRETLDYIRSHNFRVITTRVYYPGKHAVSIIANGKEGERVEFRLKKK